CGVEGLLCNCVCSAGFAVENGTSRRQTLYITHRGIFDMAKWYLGIVVLLLVTVPGPASRRGQQDQVPTFQERWNISIPKQSSNTGNSDSAETPLNAPAAPPDDTLKLPLIDGAAHERQSLSNDRKGSESVPLPRQSPLRRQTAKR